ncbi:hypothetical protein LTR66_013890 [Elasticomyces elasticus]|nr:hypothetical protein LTR66_013890 [Elasticomyces elasticus]KAK5005291.1 hypothetical protein LTR28_007897 [Elasticomyces elasticus]
MFGLIISGRPLNAQPLTPSPTQFAFQIPSSPPFTHLVLFLLPGASFPVGTAATVWIQIPPSTEFRLLGGLATEKQSAIFKININGVKATLPADAEGDVMIDEDSVADGMNGNSNGIGDIVVGISVEPIDSVSAQLATLSTGAQQQPSNAVVRHQPPTSPAAGALAAVPPLTTKVLAQKIISNAFNFLASFGSDTVPLKAFQDWWAKFEKKVELDPGFLERE